MKRRGTSLMEVLIAIFILALGLVSLLTLFPIGFVQMARAVQDERAAQLAGNAASYMRMLWKDACEASARNTPGGQPLFTDAMSLNSFVGAMDDPSVFLDDGGLAAYLASPSANPASVTPWLLTPPSPPVFPSPSVDLLPGYAANRVSTAIQRLKSQATLTRPSYPVFVDPVGWLAAGSDRLRDWVAFQADTKLYYTIPRRHVPSMVMNGTTTPSASKVQAIRNCMLQDDMEYTFDGVAKLNERLAQYSCAWLLRRDNNNKRTETNVTVVVYHRRSIETLSDEVPFHVDPQVLTSTSTFPRDTPGRATVPVTPSTVGSDWVFPSSITLTYTAANRPPLRRGSWILDATMDAGQTQGFYYRVADFTETEGTGGIFQNVLQLETRLRPRQVEVAALSGGPVPAPRLIIIQDRVLEVFDKGPLEMNSPSRIN